MIEVTISLLDIVEASEPWVAEMMILGKLRDAGIPVKGFFHFQSLERGTLYETTTFDGGLRYWWEE
jgi:hypothetical protein